MNVTTFQLQNKSYERSGIESIWIPLAPYAQINGLKVYFCKTGEPIPPGEVIGALSNAMTDVLPHLENHPIDPIPGRSFQKSTLFRPDGDRVTVFLHTVGGYDLTWLGLARVLTEVEGYIDGTGGPPRRQHFHELAFFVRDDDNLEVAVGRIQYIPGQVPRATERRI